MLSKISLSQPLSSLLVWKRESAYNRAEKNVSINKISFFNKEISGVFQNLRSSAERDLGTMSKNIKLQIKGHIMELILI